MGGFLFQDSHLEMVRHGVPMGEDDIFPNCIDTYIIDKSNIVIPFRGGQEMHVSTLRVLIHLYNLFGSLIVTINSSTSMSS
jgi:hypothetical protein